MGNIREHYVLKVEVLEAGKMCKRKDLSKFNKEPDWDGYTLGQSISKITAVLCCSQSAVVSVYKK